MESTCGTTPQHTHTYHSGVGSKCLRWLCLSISTVLPNPEGPLSDRTPSRNMPDNNGILTNYSDSVGIMKVAKFSLAHKNIADNWIPDILIDMKTPHHKNPQKYSLLPSSTCVSGGRDGLAYPIL